MLFSAVRAFFSTSVRLTSMTLATVIAMCWSLQAGQPMRRVIAFYTGVNDVAHVSYVQECNRWFPQVCHQNNIVYESTNDWSLMREDHLALFDAVLFLDTRPEDAAQRAAFRAYMENGGGWMGFHFAAFALTPSAYNQDWDWYHNDFLGSGQYKGNTWAPTTAILRVEDTTHATMAGLGTIWTASPNEWYSWQNDLTLNPSITILCSIDPASFPLGTGPKEWEIWHSGYYPVVWTNTGYRMIYINMGHNDIDYGNNNQAKSWTYDNPVQAQMVVNALEWLVHKAPVRIAADSRPAVARPGARIDAGRHTVTVQVTGAGDFSILLQDLQGRELARVGSATRWCSIDRTHLAAGAYVLTVRRARSVESYRITLP